MIFLLFDKSQSVSDGNRKKPLIPNFKKLCLLTVATYVIAMDDGLAATSAPTPKKWYPAIHLGGKYGNQRRIGQFGLFTPVAQSPTDLLYLDLRFVADSRSAKEGNFGLGKRWFADNNQFILGFYGFYDLRHTELGNKVNQLTLGFEAMSETWDYRANVYCPEDTVKEVVKSEEIITPRHSHFEGVYEYYVNDQSLRITKIREVPLKGLDLEIGRSMPGIKPLRVYGAYYHFQGRAGAPTINGFRARANLELNPYVSFQVEGTYDRVRRTVGFVGVSFRIPLGKPDSKAPPLSDLDKRMTEQPMRDIDIVTSRAAPSISHEPKGVTGKPYIHDIDENIAFVRHNPSSWPQSDSTEAPPGTYENPYDLGKPAQRDELSQRLRSYEVKRVIVVDRRGGYGPLTHEAFGKSISWPSLSPSVSVASEASPSPTTPSSLSSSLLTPASSPAFSPSPLSSPSGVGGPVAPAQVFAASLSPEPSSPSPAASASVSPPPRSVVSSSSVITAPASSGTVLTLPTPSLEVRSPVPSQPSPGSSPATQSSDSRSPSSAVRAPATLSAENPTAESLSVQRDDSWEPSPFAHPPFPRMMANSSVPEGHTSSVLVPPRETSWASSSAFSPSPAPGVAPLSSPSRELEATTLLSPSRAASPSDFFMPTPPLLGRADAGTSVSLPSPPADSPSPSPSPSAHSPIASPPLPPSPVFSPPVVEAVTPPPPPSPTPSVSVVDQGETRVLEAERERVHQAERAVAEQERIAQERIEEKARQEETFLAPQKTAHDAELEAVRGRGIVQAKIEEIRHAETTALVEADSRARIEREEAAAGLVITETAEAERAFREAEAKRQAASQIQRAFRAHQARRVLITRIKAAEQRERERALIAAGESVGRAEIEGESRATGDRLAMEGAETVQRSAIERAERAVRGEIMRAFAASNLGREEASTRAETLRQESAADEVLLSKGLAGVARQQVVDEADHGATQVIQAEAAERALLVAQTGLVLTESVGRTAIEREEAAAVGLVITEAAETVTRKEIEAQEEIEWGALIKNWPPKGGGGGSVVSTKIPEGPGGSGGDGGPTPTPFAVADDTPQGTGSGGGGGGNAPATPKRMPNNVPGGSGGGGGGSIPPELLPPPGVAERGQGDGLLSTEGSDGSDPVPRTPPSSKRVRSGSGGGGSSPSPRLPRSGRATDVVAARSTSSAVAKQLFAPPPIATANKSGRPVVTPGGEGVQERLVVTEEQGGDPRSPSVNFLPLPVASPAPAPSYPRVDALTSHAPQGQADLQPLPLEGTDGAIVVIDATAEANEDHADRYHNRPIPTASDGGATSGRVGAGVDAAESSDSSDSDGMAALLRNDNHPNLDLDARRVALIRRRTAVQQRGDQLFHREMSAVTQSLLGSTPATFEVVHDDTPVTTGATVQGRDDSSPDPGLVKLLAPATDTHAAEALRRRRQATAAAEEGIREREALSGLRQPTHTPDVEALRRRLQETTATATRINQRNSNAEPKRRWTLSSLFRRNE